MNEAFQSFGILLLSSVVAAACGGSSKHGLGSGADIDDAGDAGALPIGGDGGVSGDAGGSAGDGPSSSGTAGSSGGSTATGGSAPEPRGGSGATSAGGAANPAGGDAGTYVPPEECEARGQGLTTTSCSVQLSCDGDYIEADCADVMSTGIQDCWCESSTRQHNLQLGGGGGFAACHVMAEACRSGMDPLPAGPAECRHQVVIQNTLVCETREICERPLEGDTGITLATWSDVYCGGDSQGTEYCKCRDVPYEYTVVGQDGTTVCDDVFELCQDPEPPNFDDAPWDCQPEFENSDGVSCQKQERCVRTAPIRDDISVSERKALRVGCSSAPGGGTTCSCSGWKGQVTVAMGAEWTSASCSGAFEICRDLANAEFTEPDCSTVGGSAEADFCDEHVQCSASASLNGAEVAIFDTASVDCNQADDAWACTCYASLELTEMPGEGLDARDVCANASLRCADRLDFELSDDPP